jgi:nitroreductase
MELFDAIKNRHSCRAFRPDPVPRDELEKLVAAAKEAPSAFNEQPWHFYVTSGESRARVGEVMAQSTRYLDEYIDVFGQDFYDMAVQWYSDLGHAPVIVVCTMPASKDEHERAERIFAIASAVQNMLLAATDLGLAACNISFGHWVADELLEAVHAPDGVELAGLVVLGYPNDDFSGAPAHDAPDVSTFMD